MIEGIVTEQREATVAARVRGPHGHCLEVDAAIDTGFDGFLTLPADVIRLLELPFVMAARATLGDGRKARISLFAAVIEWDGREVPASVMRADVAPLVGTALLDGFELRI
jgi:clan AA aspartic protease